MLSFVGLIVYLFIVLVGFSVADRSEFVSVFNWLFMFIVT